MATVPTDPLAGAWRLVAAHMVAEDGTRSGHDLYGPAPKGGLVHAGGRMTALLKYGGPAPADGAVPFMLAYTGRVTVGPDTLTTRVDAASIPSWEGTEQTRHYTLDGDRLTLRTPAGRHPAHPDRDVYGILEFRRDG
jgi:hypothetical protein